MLLQKSKLGISGISAQLFRSVTNVAGRCDAIKVFSLHPPSCGGEGGNHKLSRRRARRGSPSTRRLEQTSSVSAVKQAHAKDTDGGTGGLSSYPIVVFVLERTTLASSQGPSRGFRPTTCCSLRACAKINVHYETQRWESAS